MARVTRLADPPFFAGERALPFDARKSYDEDRDTAQAEWLAIYCDAEDECAPLSSRMVLGLDEEFELVLADKGNVQIQLTVTDKHGAQSRDVEVITVQNREPSADLQVEQPRVIGTPIRVFAQIEDADDDPGEIALDWKVFAPTGSDPNVRSFTEIDPTTYQLIPDVEGLWEVAITATDPDGATGDATRSFLVEPDGPPCIALTDPPAAPGYVFDRDGGPRRLAVLEVDDALDPYPPAADPPDHLGQASFAWWIASPDTGGDLVPLAGHAAADLVLDPAPYTPGDRFTLRVEVADRVERPPSCGDQDPTCGEEECLQRVTWEVEIR